MSKINKKLWPDSHRVPRATRAVQKDPKDKEPEFESLSLRSPRTATIIIMIIIISNSVYDYLKVSNILPSEQKRCKKKSRGTKDQLLIDKTVMKDCNKRHTNLGMAWIDYRKAYDMIPHSWILESLKMVNVADNVIEMLKRSMNNWNVNSTSSGHYLGNVNIRRGIHTHIHYFLRKQDNFMAAQG